ncbi:VIT1/CCC1 transporter family protein [Candidatus Microgenomates bacterium]|nr:VIT1/CCC1 transporter family protein [Candidatus Microgenomates bacterium]
MTLSFALDSGGAKSGATSAFFAGDGLTNKIAKTAKSIGKMHQYLTHLSYLKKTLKGDRIKLMVTFEKHTTSNWLYDIILGGQDGLVNVLGIVLGVSAAGGGNKIIVAASLAAAFAEAVSMGAVAYTSALSAKDHYEKEWQREEQEIDTVPEKERDELREIYTQRGFSGDLLEKIIQTLTANRQVWLKTMMAEELNLEPVDANSIVRQSFIVGVAALIASFVPIWPFIFFAPQLAVPVSLVVSAVTLFFAGAYEAKTFVGVWWKKGGQMVLIGLGAALAGFSIGKIFQV